MLKKSAITLLVFIFLTGIVFSQEPYKIPPKNILDIVTTPRTPRASFSPTGELMALTVSESMPFRIHVPAAAENSRNQDFAQIQQPPDH